MNRLIQLTLNNVLFRRVGVLSLGVAAGQAISLLSSPILTRLVDPHTFGVFGAFASLSFLIGNISVLRYDLGIILAKSRSQAAAIAALCLAILAVVTIALTVVLLFGGSQMLADMMDSKELAEVLPWAPIQVIAIGLFLVSGQWATRHKLYSAQAMYQFTRASLIAILQIVAAYLAFGVYGLVAAQIAAFFIAVAILVKRTVWRDRKILLGGFSLKRMRTVAVRFRQLPQFTAPQDLMTALTQNLPYFILGGFFGANILGFYWLTIRTMQFPVNFISQSVRQVLLQHTTALVNEKKRVFGSVWKSTAGLAGIGAFTFSPLIFFGPVIFALLFGEDWREAGEYSRWVALWMFTVLFKIPGWCVFHALKRQKLQFAFEASMFVSQSLTLFVLSYLSTPLLAIAGYTTVCALFNCAMTATALRLARQKDQELA